MITLFFYQDVGKKNTRGIILPMARVGWDQSIQTFPMGINPNVNVIAYYDVVVQHFVRDSAYT